MRAGGVSIPGSPNKNRKGSVLNYFSEINLKMNNDGSNLEDASEKLQLKEMELKILNCDELYDKMSDLIFKQSKTSKANEIVLSEFEKTKYVAKGAFTEFFTKLNKYKTLSRKGVLVNTPSFNLIEGINENLIIPNPNGLIKRRGNPEKLNLKNLGKGDEYVNALTKSMKLADHFTEINLTDNRLVNSVGPFLDTIRTNFKLFKNIGILNLSYNKLSKSAIDSLCLFVQEPDCEITSLNLEANCLGNELMSNLLNEIANNLNYKLKYLNIGQNNLNNLTAISLSNMVDKCTNLKVLIMYWNQINNEGASLIMKKVKKHFEMKFLDFSWNLIGSNFADGIPTKEELEKSKKDTLFPNAELVEVRYTDFATKKKLIPLKNSVSKFAKELGELFREKSSELIHLDISHNNIGQADSEFISNEVKNNHIILGIHCDGNEMAIDELGFIDPIPKNKYSTHYAHSQIYYKIEEEHPLIETNILNTRKIRAKNNCWICEGWREIKFVYNPKTEIIKYELEKEEIIVKLHLSFENYKSFDTIVRGDQYICHRMCPPGEFMFYFTINGIPVENCGQITHNLKEALIHAEKDENGDMREYIVTKVAKSHAEINPNVIDQESYRKLIKYCEPRPEKKIIKKFRPRTPWSYPISIWAIYDYPYEGEPDEIVEDAFEFDYKRCNIVKELEDGESPAEFKNMLRGYYRKILDCYRYLASQLGSNIWQINKTSMFDFASNLNGLITDAYNLNIMYLKQSEAINSIIDKQERTKNKNKNVPDNIIRHQFLSLLVKVAVDKYIYKSNTFKNTIDAVKFAFETHYMPTLKNYDLHTWRIEKYYNEPVDNIIKAYLPVFDAIYKSWVPIKDGRRE